MVNGVELVLDLLQLEVLERRELQLAHQLHAVHAHERVHHDQYVASESFRDARQTRVLSVIGISKREANERAFARRKTDVLECVLRVRVKFVLVSHDAIKVSTSTNSIVCQRKHIYP